MVVARLVFEFLSSVVFVALIVAYARVNWSSAIFLLRANVRRHVSGQIIGGQGSIYQIYLSLAERSLRFYESLIIFVALFSQII